MSNQSRLHELNAKELSERAEGYAALAKDVESDETRETFERMASLCARLSVERKAAENRATRH